MSFQSTLTRLCVGTTLKLALERADRLVCDFGMLVEGLCLLNALVLHLVPHTGEFELAHTGLTAALLLREAVHRVMD